MAVKSDISGAREGCGEQPQSLSSQVTGSLLARDSEEVRILDLLIRIQKGEPRS